MAVEMVVSAGGLGERWGGGGITSALTALTKFSVLAQKYSAKLKGQGVDMCSLLEHFSKGGSLFLTFMSNKGIQGRASGGVVSMSNRGSCAIGLRHVAFSKCLGRAA